MRSVLIINNSTRVPTLSIFSLFGGEKLGAFFTCYYLFLIASLGRWLLHWNKWSNGKNVRLNNFHRWWLFFWALRITFWKKTIEVLSVTDSEGKTNVVLNFTSLVSQFNDPRLHQGFVETTTWDSSKMLLRKWTQFIIKWKLMLEERCESKTISKLFFFVSSKRVPNSRKFWVKLIIQALRLSLNRS